MKVVVSREPQVQPSAWLGASWARAHIRELEDKYAVGARELEGDIVRVSKQFGVLSRFTAFLAVDRSEVVNKGGNLVQVVQPVEQPAGWDMLARGGVMAAPGGPPMGGAMPFAAPRAMAAGPMSAAGSLGGPPSPAKARGRMPQGPDASPPRPAPMAPPPPPAASFQNVPMREYSRKEEAADVSPYLVKLATFARDLEALARDGAALGALRLMRQRLAEWVEDLRSVGGHDALADAVEHEVKRLSAALAGANDLAGEVRAVAAELARLAAGGAPPRKAGRAEFWK
jgi:Ca-activated chloride channel family protein